MCRTLGVGRVKSKHVKCVSAYILCVSMLTHQSCFVYMLTLNQSCFVPKKLSSLLRSTAGAERSGGIILHHL
jgi:hypothetical protein